MTAAATPAAARAVRVTLYVAGDAPNSLGARAHLAAAVTELSGQEIEVEIVDVVSDPDRGLRDGVLVTPMLIRCAPLPERRILGNLRDRALLLAVLGRAASEP